MRFEQDCGGHGATAAIAGLAFGRCEMGMACRGKTQIRKESWLADLPHERKKKPPRFLPNPTGYSYRGAALAAS